MNVAKMNSKYKRSTWEPNAVVAVALAVVLCMGAYPVTVWFKVGHPSVAARVGSLLIALAYSGLSTVGATRAVRSFLRMKSFEGLLLLPVFLVHIFFFYLGSGNVILMLFMPSAARPIHHSQSNAVDRITERTSRNFLGSQSQDIQAERGAGRMTYPDGEIGL